MVTRRKLSSEIRRNTSKLHQCPYCSKRVFNIRRHRATSMSCHMANGRSGESIVADSPHASIPPSKICPLPNQYVGFMTIKHTNRSLANALASGVAPINSAMSVLTGDSVISNGGRLLNNDWIQPLPNQERYYEDVSSNNDYNSVESESSDSSVVEYSMISTDKATIHTFDDDILLSQVITGNIIVSVDDPLFHRHVSPQFYAYAQMYNVLRKLKVPLYGYDLLIKTIVREVANGNISRSGEHMSRNTFLNEMKHRFSTTEPTTVSVHLETRWNENGDCQLRDTVEVITFDFESQLQDLLSDHSLFGDINNLVVNKDSDDPESKWLPYEPQNNEIFEVLDGSWYQHYARLQITDSTRQFSFPIGLYIDASQTVTYQRYSFQPLMFFPLVLSCKARNIKTSSKVLALIPDLDARSSAVKSATRAGGVRYKGTPLRHYHACMDAGMYSLKECQQRGGFVTYMRIEKEVRHRLLKVPVAFILGDAKSQDCICGRFGGHNTSRMCRACDVSYQDSCNVDYECGFVHDKDFDVDINTALNTDDQFTKKEVRQAFRNLKAWSQHAVINCFDGIDFAGFPRGVFGCTPHDMMHAFLEGILKYCTRIFIKRYTSAQKAQIDMFVDHIFGFFRSSEKPNMPRTNFCKGMTNLTMITADEEAGMALTLLIVAQMDRGHNLLEIQYDADVSTVPSAPLIDDATVTGSISRDVDSDSSTHETSSTSHEDETDDNNIPPKKCSPAEFIHLIEIMLSFHAWYKSEKPIPWSDGSRDILLSSMREMLRRLKKVLPRTEGNKWNIQKFHEMLHLPFDVENFGSPKNFDTGIMENRLIHVGKHNSKTTQRRGPRIYTRQLGERIYEQELFLKTKRCLGLPDLDDNNISSSEDSDVSTLSIDHPLDSFTSKKRPCYKVWLRNNRIKFQWLTRKKCNVPDLVLRQLKKIMQQFRLSHLEVFTEIHHKEKIYRAHPDYRGGGSWYDWCCLRFVPSETDRLRHADNLVNGITEAYPAGYYPAKTLAFFFIGTALYFVGHCTRTKLSCNDDSCLTERWNLEYRPKRIDSPEGISVQQVPVLEAYEVECIHDRLYVVEEDPGLHPILSDKSDLVLLVKNRDMWPPYFTDTTV